MHEIYSHAVKLLRQRDYTVEKLSQKLAVKFGAIPAEVIDELTRKNFLNDRRFAENYVRRRKDRGRKLLRGELIALGVAEDLVDEILSQTDWPSLHKALTVKMNDWNLRPPLQSRDAARLFRALLRLGYDADAIQEEIEQLREQQSS